MNDNEWLKELKAGDEVFVSGQYGAIATGPYKVKRTTATKIVLSVQGATQEFESGYRVKDGFTIGGDAWSRNFLIRDTPEIRAKVAAHNELAKASRTARLIDLELRNIRRVGLDVATGWRIALEKLAKEINAAKGAKE